MKTKLITFNTKSNNLNYKFKDKDTEREVIVNIASKNKWYGELYRAVKNRPVETIVNIDVMNIAIVIDKIEIKQKDDKITIFGNVKPISDEYGFINNYLKNKSFKIVPRVLGEMQANSKDFYVKKIITFDIKIDAKEG